MKKKVELLAPAGGMDQLKAALYNGADAIYFGGERFSARAKAQNFTRDEVILARRLTRKYEVKLYCALNILLFDHEFDRVLEYIGFLDAVGIDALIIQDMGLLSLVRTHFPKMEIHSSTQMSIQNHYGLRALEELGVKRAVLPRETSLKDLEKMQGTGMELELFVHGAICISFSGQCLMSSMIGGRSGNRGACAQPCRLKYSLLEFESEEVLKEDIASYLSPKDLMLLSSLPKLIELGVYSFKIEGRMKTPEYVATVVRQYRKAIDEAVAERAYELKTEDREEIAQVFSRDFTDAYLYGNSGPELMNINKPNNRGVLLGRVNYAKSGKVEIRLKTPLILGDKLSIWTTIEGRVNFSVDRIMKDDRLVNSANPGDLVILDIPKRVNKDDRVFKIESAELGRKVKEQIRDHAIEDKIGLKVTLSGQVGEALTLAMEDEEGYRGEIVSEYIIEEAIKHPLDEMGFREQMRLGDTHYTLTAVTLNIGKVMVPKSLLNTMRREGIASLMEQREATYNITPPKRLQESFSDEVFGQKVLSVTVETLDKLRLAMRKELQYLYYPLMNFRVLGSSEKDFYTFLQSLEPAQRNRLVLELPRICREEELDLILETINKFLPLIRNFKAHTLDQISMLQDLGVVNIHGDASLNVFNQESYAFYRDTMKLTVVELSKELNLGQLYQLPTQGQLGIFGIVELMVLEHCILGSELGKGACRGKRYKLRDRMGMDFPILVDEMGKNHLLNSKTLMLTEELATLMQNGFMQFTLNFIGRSLKEMEEILDIYLSMISKDISNEAGSHKLKAIVENYTKGHYNRGVL